MARIPRGLTVFPGYSVHKIWRGHNREWNLSEIEDKRKYLQFLNEDLENDQYRQGATIQAATLMSNHSHEIYGVVDQGHFSNHMRRHHSRYGAHFNVRHDRCGKVAQDRPRTCTIEDDHRAMIALFYIHANPLRAKIVRDAKNYFWSTHRLYAYGKRESWMRNVTLAPWYLRLGKSMSERQRKYRRLFDQYCRREGLSRNDFLNRMFFGTPEWVTPHQEAIKAWRKERPPP